MDFLFGGASAKEICISAVTLSQANTSTTSQRLFTLQSEPGRHGPRGNDPPQLPGCNTKVQNKIRKTRAKKT